MQVQDDFIRQKGSDFYGPFAVLVVTKAFSRCGTRQPGRKLRPASMLRPEMGAGWRCPWLQIARRLPNTLLRSAESSEEMPASSAVERVAGSHRIRSAGGRGYSSATRRSSSPAIGGLLSRSSLAAHRFQEKYG